MYFTCITLNLMFFSIVFRRDLRPQSLEKSQERWRLHIYEVYAWGVPLLIAGTAGILDSVETPNVFITPGFAENNCWFRGAYIYAYTRLLSFISINSQYMSIPLDVLYSRLLLFGASLKAILRMLHRCTCFIHHLNNKNTNFNRFRSYRCLSP